MQNIRNVINKNRVYAWMMIVTILIQAYAASISAGKPAGEKDHLLTKEEFRLQLEEKRNKLQDKLEEDPELAAYFGFIFLFVLILLIIGTVFLIDYLMKKKDNIEAIQATFKPPDCAWTLADVLRVIILVVFFAHLYSLLAHTLGKSSFLAAPDKRAGMVISTVFVDIVVFASILWLVNVKYRQGVKALGISSEGLLRNIGIAAYSYIGFLPVLVLIFIGVLSVSNALNYTPAPEPIYELVFEEKRPLLLVVISALISVTGPLIEEVFFRGFLYGALRRRFNIFLAMFFSAFVFSSLHTNVLGFIPILALGMFLAYLREKTGSLIPSITVHIMHNTALASLMFFIKDITSRA